jgi:diacylglycerol kinase
MNKSPSRWSSLKVAFEGISSLLKTEKNTWIYIPISLIVIALGFYFQISLPEWLSLVICIGLVWSFEAMNTSLEALVNLSSPEIHAMAKIAKDCAAAGVLIAAITSAVVGILVFLPYFLKLFGLTE